MATYVLVHGAWCSGWFWHKVTPLLCQAGHKTFAPTLTGLGERAHLLRPDIGLDTHILDVLGVIEYEDLRDVVLVGWSYADMVITGAASRAPERLAHLVYLDGGVPWDGECSFDLLDPSSRAAVEERARNDGDGWKIPPNPLQAWMHYVERGELSEAEIRTIHARARAQPLKAMQDPVRRTSAAAALPCTYINCTLNKPPGVSSDMQRAREAGCRYREVHGAHSALLTHPRVIADLLLELA
jgi:pimeloyl-ACP methyl ester carboxylesterase